MVSSTVVKESYKGDGKTKSFPFHFPFINKKYIHVKIYDGTTQETTELKKDFFINETAKTIEYPGYAPGQEIAKEDQPDILTAAQTITIYRDTEVNQLAELGSKYPLPVIEGMADKTTHVLQEIKDELTRTVHVDVGDPYSPDEKLTELQDYVKSAATSAESANKSQVSAETAATRAGVNATNAGEAEDAAENARIAAESARDAAKKSEAAAQSTASKATTNATNAAASATQAAQDAQDAKGYKENAKTSEQNAKASADAAIESEKKAKTAEENAAKNETAAGSARAAAEKAQTAAETAKNGAEKAQSAATQSATNAQASADAAEKSAKAAKESEDTSQIYANAAIASETSAKEQAGKAADSASAAAASEQAATSAKTAAEDAKTASETAKTAAEEAAKNLKTSERNAQESATAAATSATNAANSETAAKKWATAEESPDDAFDEKAESGKTQSSRTWAIEAREGATSAKDNAEKAADYATNLKDTIAKAQEIKDSITTIQASIESLQAQTNQCLIDAQKLKDSITGAVRYCGTVENYADLPTEGQVVGDLYNIANADKANQVNAGDNVIWSGDGWDVMAGFFDTSDLAHMGADVSFKTVTADSFNGKATSAGTADTAAAVDWANITNAPTSLPANGGTADTAKSADTAAVCTGNAASASSVAWDNVTGKPSTYAPAAHNHDSAYPSTTGARASGTWGISITGNAATATTASGVAWANVTGKPSTYAPAAHNHDSAYPSTTGARASGTWDISISGTANKANSATSAGYSDKVNGTYSGNGGQQGPGYFGKNRAGFLMSNATINNDTHYKNWLYMDNYSGTDVGGTTAFGLDRNEPKAFLMQSDANRNKWNNTAEFLTTYNYNSYTPTKTGGGASGTWGINVTGTAGGVAWGNVTGKPSTYAPAAHNHDSAYPSTTGTRASGTWAINISGKATTAGTADKANSVAWENVTGKPSIGQTQPTKAESIVDWNKTNHITKSGYNYSTGDIYLTQSFKNYDKILVIVMQEDSGIVKTEMYEEWILEKSLHYTPSTLIINTDYLWCSIRNYNTGTTEKCFKVNGIYKCGFIDILGIKY